MQTHDYTTIPRFLDPNPETALTNEFFAIFTENRAGAAGTVTR
jgi:hypothetical protein